MRVYLRSKAATDSPVFAGKFHFLSTNGRLKGTNIGFGYYFFDLRPILCFLDLSPHNKLYAQNRFLRYAILNTHTRAIININGKNANSFAPRIYDEKLCALYYIIYIQYERDCRGNVKVSNVNAGKPISQTPRNYLKIGR